jgi:hypothetical protein
MEWSSLMTTSVLSQTMTVYSICLCASIPAKERLAVACAVLPHGGRYALPGEILVSAGVLNVCGCTEYGGCPYCTFIAGGSGRRVAAGSLPTAEVTSASTLTLTSPTSNLGTSYRVIPNSTSQSALTPTSDHVSTPPTSPLNQGMGVCRLVEPREGDALKVKEA